jgi:hypothetical protein
VLGTEHTTEGSAQVDVGQGRSEALGVALEGAHLDLALARL